MIFNLKIHPILAAGLLAGFAALTAPGLSANAQNLAAAAPSNSVAKPRPGYMIFFEPSSTEVSPTAAGTIRTAARAARANKAPMVRIVGRADHAEAVKAELVRQGISASSILLVGRDDTGPLVRASTGVAEPINRRVLIAF
ncbi:MAG: hypothetical protein PSV46_07160 [Reyranella sp.]|nr:hypothetical protein [Reyranella sp.]